MVLEEAAIAVWGPNGFIGRSFVSHIKEIGFKVDTYSPKTHGLKQCLSQYRSQLSSNRITATVYCIGTINGSLKKLHYLNIEILKNIIDTISLINTKHRLIFISSVSALEKLGNYGKSKAKAEDILINSSLSEWIILRPSLIFGPHDTKNIGILIKWFKNSFIVPIPWHNSIKLQPLFVSDLCKIIGILVKKRNLGKKLFTIAGPEQISFINIAKTIKKETFSKALIIPIPLKLIQFFLNFLCTLWPTVPLPVQQFRFLCNHPVWNSSEVMDLCKFQLMDFNSALKSMLEATESS